MPGIHYNLSGMGRAIVAADTPIRISPHTLFITPPGKPLRIEADGRNGPVDDCRLVEFDEFGPAELRRFVAGDTEPKITLICGYFRASYGASIELFANLRSPIVEIFDERERLDRHLRSALAEFVAREVGSGAMTAALMKQVLVTILRRSLSSIELWVERFSILGDPHIARAFADMVARPGAPHSIRTLSQTSGLSRSAFMARFNDVFGAAPMTVLRQIRMRHAATLLEAGKLAVDQIARAVGYMNASSFLRAFRKAYGRDPSDYRARSRKSVHNEAK
jgi:AraC family transcriptional activator of mtrCDE